MSTNEKDDRRRKFSGEEKMSKREKHQCDEACNIAWDVDLLVQVDEGDRADANRSRKDRRRKSSSRNQSEARLK